MTDSLASLHLYLNREGGIPSPQDFEDAGFFVDGCTVYGEALWQRFRMSTANRDEFKIVGFVIQDGPEHGRFLVYRGDRCATEKVIHKYKITP